MRREPDGFLEVKITTMEYVMVIGVNKIFGDKYGWVTSMEFKLKWIPTTTDVQLKKRAQYKKNTLKTDTNLLRRAHAIFFTIFSTTSH